MALKLNSEIKDQALATLQDNWKQPVLAMLLYMVICSVAAIPYASIAVSIFLILPIEYSLVVSYLDFFRGDKEDMVGKLFNCFGNYGRILGISLLRTVYILLWSLLLIIPGIIKTYSYAMTYFISIDHPEYTAEEAITSSMAMMDGNKMKLFMLDLSFIGWFLLCLLTLGIGFLWLYPYIYTAHAAFYEDLKANAVL